ncbi:cation acetate symporter [Streptomyces ipomoeae]|uniref:sodium/solute symporter n=1 Tax=Streptomyces ipomoeae TaxID=103232 RepID=UPI0011470C49|nr:cation acetate symporter [Streptomyces ipomoeae]MDX2938176.1 cation acetate symporter [Streptomyces ipomoeae]TQE27011.1 cation acetate symporter [Streptomyces ipomoeae]
MTRDYITADLPVFFVFLVCALFLVMWAGPQRGTVTEFYVSDGTLKPAHNGVALFGDVMSAAALLGSPGLIALTGYDGTLSVLGPAVSWIVILLLVVDRYHSTTEFTIGDRLARRLRSRPVHLAAGVATLLVCLLYLIAQLVGASALTVGILGSAGEGMEQAVSVGLGALMILYIVLGGMRAATLVQTIKAVLLVGGGLALALLVLARFEFNPGALLSAAANGSGHGDDFLSPGLRFGEGGSVKLDSLSEQLALLIGAAGLPHLLMRISTVSTPSAARRSVQYAAQLTCVFYLAAMVLGFGAAALVGTDAIAANNPSGNTAVLLLAAKIGGSLLLTLVACLAFATVLAVVAGVTLAAATSLAHDIYGAFITRGTASGERELFVARVAAVVVGTTATMLAVFARSLNVSFLIGLAFALAGSAIVPALLYSMFWKGFTTRGATWSIYGGLVTSVALMCLSPQVSGSPTALLPDLDFSVFPLRNPALVSIPVGFLLGWLGSVLSGSAERTDAAPSPRTTSEDIAWHR